MKRQLLIALCILVTGNWSLQTVEAQINTDRMILIGRNALYLEDYVMAIQHFNQVIKAKPYLAEPYLYRAIAKYSLDDFRGAENDLTLCLERNSFLPQAYWCRGASRQNRGDFANAIADYSQGLKFLPEDKQMLLNQAIAYAQTKDYDAALRNLDLLVKYHPKFPQGYLARGSVYGEKGDTAQAFANYDKALSLDKYYAPIYAQRAILYLQQEMYAQALMDCNQAVLLEPDRAGYYINRGLARYHLNDLRGAMADYDKVLAMDAHNQIAQFNRGLLRSQVGDTHGAIEDFNHVLEWDSENFMAMYNLSLLHKELGNLKESRAYLEKVVAEYPNSILAATQTEVKVDKTKKTREKSDKNISKFNRLVVYDAEEEQKSKYADELRGRVQDREVKIDLEPPFEPADNEKLPFNRAYALNQQKEHLAAIAAYTEAIQMNPEFAKAYYNRGLTYLYTGENELGIADLSKAGELGLINAYSVIKKMSAE